MNIRILCQLTILTVLPFAALAGPDDTTRYYMNNSPSLLDFGNFRLEAYLERNLGDQVSVLYDWENDNVDIFIGNRGYTGEDCHVAIKNVREEAGFYNGSLLEFFPVSYFSGFYSHNGYIVGDAEERERRKTELDKKFLVKCWAGGTRYEGKIADTEIRVITP